MRGGVGSLLRSSKHAAAWMGGRGMAQGHGMARGRMRLLWRHSGSAVCCRVHA